MSEFEFTSGNGHVVHDWEADAARMIAALVMSFCAEHEAEHHEGSPCMPTRASIAAYIAYNIGLTQSEEHTECMLGLMADLEERRQRGE